MRYSVIFFLFVLCGSAYAQRFHWESTGGPGTDAITCLQVNTNGDIVIVGNQRLLRSTDHGNHWIQVELPDSLSDIKQIVALPGGRLALGLDHSIRRIESDGTGM